MARHAGRHARRLLRDHARDGGGNALRRSPVGAGVGLDVVAGWLEAAGVPPGAVVVGDAPGPDGVWRIRAVGADAADDAGPGEGWEVFWAEGGVRRAWVRFDDEATACFALLGRLAWARLVRATP